MLLNIVSLKHILCIFQIYHSLLYCSQYVTLMSDIFGHPCSMQSRMLKQSSPPSQVKSGKQTSVHKARYLFSI